MSKPTSFLIVFVFIGFLFYFIQNTSRPLPSPSPCQGEGEGVRCINYVKLAGQNIKVELALTPAEQVRGLSGRAGLDENEGMLFVFENPGRHSFWMQDMNFAIDIIWLNESKQVVYIKKDARPESYPEAFGGEVTSKYVFEVISGFSEKNNIKEGDRAEFSLTRPL